MSIGEVWAVSLACVLLSAGMWYFLDSSLTAATSISMILLCTNSTIVDIPLVGANICDRIDNGM